MSCETVLYEVSDRIATITLNRPERMNAWNGTMAAEVSAALSVAGDDDAVRAIVLPGAGRGFCAGADLQGAQTPSPGTRTVPATTPARRR